MRAGGRGGGEAQLFSLSQGEVRIPYKSLDDSVFTLSRPYELGTKTLLLFSFYLFGLF